MSIMCSEVKGDNVVMFELVAGKNGDPIYKISWYNGTRWMSARYKHFEDAHQTWRLLSRMI